jgi:REP element-mobilizing transposase RayT
MNQQYRRFQVALIDNRYYIRSMRKGERRLASGVQLAEAGRDERPGKAARQKQKRPRKRSKSPGCGQLMLIKPRGGKRRGAGRKPKERRASEAHRTRPEHDHRHPVHVVLRVVSEVGNLRRREAYRAIREATQTAAVRESFRIVHVSIQRTHVHMLVEAKDKQALSAGVQGFQISAAKHLNAAIGRERGEGRRRGRVFADRFHAVVIESPRQARHVLSYVMNNWRKHGEHGEAPAAAWKIDPYSSAIRFQDWKERADQPPWCAPPTYVPLVVSEPRTWLLRTGWKRHGAISYCEVPSAHER